ncbi:MAG: hypothetical protein M1828_000821 [Chrysothrix sp. TS-e1954]|nr:MAG: hypothetical protein M1828_000821 [Chrysothrix sp. TS-e1954]
MSPRRAQYEEEYPEEYSDDKEGFDDGYRPSRQAHRSAHSVRSMASTVMTRASNVIQIAFIPGITDRSGSDGPNSAIPPVPPVPLELADTQPATPYSARQIPPSPYTDTASTDHYFMPQDLRQSRFSEFSDESDNRSTRHYSIASSLARASFASGVYGYGHSTVSPPVQIAQSGKANVVSVSSSQRATPGGTVPEMPSIDYIKYGQQQALAGKSTNSSTTTVSTKEVLGSPSDAKHSPMPANVMSAKSSATLLNDATPSAPRSPTAAAHTSTVPPLPSHIPGATTKGPSNLSHNTSASDIGSSASSNDQHKSSVDSRGEKKSRHTSQHLTAAIAEATKRASRQPTHGGLGSVPVQRSGEASASASRRDPSPFSDENEVREGKE